MAGTGTLHLREPGEALLRVEDLTVEFPSRRGTVYAVSGISLDILPGETLGLVGESGCGKSTTGKAIIQLPRPTRGKVVFDDVDLTKESSSRLRRLRTRLQLIFQDPISSLNPRRTVRDILREPLRIWKRGDNGSQMELITKTLEAVGLNPEVAMDKRPHQFSGGQCQRISIARALITDPQLLICDEPVSALDVSVQAQILNLLEDLKAQFGLTVIFIAHDLAVVKNVSDRVAVMYLGKLCEVGPPDRIFGNPAHHYTAALKAAIPVPDPQERIRRSEQLEGDLPSPMNPPSGCRFRTRCPAAQERCGEEEPQMREVGPSHYVACHFPLTGGTAAPIESEVAVGAPA